MKIVLALHHFLPEFVGGTEIYVANLAKQLIQKGNEVVVVVPNLGIDITEEYLFEGLRVIKFAENSIEDRAMIMGKKKPDGLKIFEELLIKELPSLIHFHELAPGRGINIFHVEKAHQLKFPVITTFHVPFYAGQYSPLLNKNSNNFDGEINVSEFTRAFYLQKKMNAFKANILTKIAIALFRLNIDTTHLNSSFGTALGFPFVIGKMKNDLVRLSFFSQKIVVIADWYKQLLEKNKVPKEKILFIKQGLSIGAIACNSAANAIKLPLRLVYVGRITQLKGLHLLIDAVLQLPDTEVSLDIYGRPTDDDYVLACKEKTKKANNIQWKGTVQTSEVISTLSGYHLLCLPSAFEMSPLVIQEAFASGIPVLASDVYGNSEQIQDGVGGWLFRFNDSEDLRKKLKDLITDPSLIAKAKKYLPELNSFEKVADDHLKLYDSVIVNYKKH